MWYFHCHPKMFCFLHCAFLMFTLLLGVWAHSLKFAAFLIFLPVPFVWIVKSADKSSHPLLLCPPLSNPSSFKYFVVVSPLGVSPSFPHLLFSPSHHCHLWFFSSYPACTVLSTSSFSHRLCLSPQDSSSFTGSVEPTGNKELDDLSQEIAQLQRWAPAPWETSDHLCFSSSELRNQVSSNWHAESVLYRLNNGPVHWENISH